MRLADKIGLFVLSNYIQPAMKRNLQGTVWVLSRDTVKQLNLHERVPAVCGALDAKKFLADSRIRLRQRTGPNFGLAAAWEFAL